MESKLQAGLNKKSFELNYNNGSIWCEHLDSMGNMSEKVTEKFTNDMSIFSRPSISSFMIINLQETNLTDEICIYIVNALSSCPKAFRKIAFVGVKRPYHKIFKSIQPKTGAIIAFLDDYEKAMEWLFNN